VDRAPDASFRAAVFARQCNHTKLLHGR
jgi:hypothetical protein